MNLVECKICNKFIGAKGFATHLKSHDILAKDYYDMYLKQPNEGYCFTCGKPTHFKSVMIGYINHCSNKCSQLDPNTKKKKENTCIRNFGVPNAYMSEEKKQKIKQTLIKRYGVDSALKLDSTRQKTYESVRSYEVKNKIKTTRQLNIIRYEVEHNCTQIIKIDNKYGQSWRVLNIPIITIGPETAFIDNKYLDIIEFCCTNSKSTKENFIEYNIRQYYDKTIIRDIRKIISPFEIDIYLPDINLGIEYNSLYRHSDNNRENISYHLNKSLLCRKKNIRLIHIYEFENFDEQMSLLKDLILGQDNYSKSDFNKNNLIDNIPKPELIYQDNKFTIYGAGKLYK